MQFKRLQSKNGTSDLINKLEHNKKIDNINREIFNCFKSLEEGIDLIATIDETINN